MPLLYSLDGANIGGFFALWAGATVERYALVFAQAFETIRLDVLKVGKQIAAAAVGSDKAKALGIVEPLYRTSLITHIFPLDEVGPDAQNAPEIKAYYRRESNRNGSKIEQYGKETDNDSLMQALPYYTDKVRKPLALFDLI